MKNVAQENLLQLKSLLQKLSIIEYTNTPEVLFGASIGQHIRHILEFYLIVISSSKTGTISYDKRNRDITIENDIAYAITIINSIIKELPKLSLQTHIELEADYTISGQSNVTIQSSIARELAYCIEHSIHHQALIKTGLISLGISNITDNNFGVAYSTIRYRNETCVQ